MADLFFLSSGCPAYSEKSRAPGGDVVVVVVVVVVDVVVGTGGSGVVSVGDIVVVVEDVVAVGVVVGSVAWAGLTVVGSGIDLLSDTGSKYGIYGAGRALGWETGLGTISAIDIFLSVKVS